jgi:peroxiredoxin (alkyl hydroperoxide reductase subunit C)
VAVSRETGKPILVCVNMDGEVASEHYAGIRYRQPEIAKLYEMIHPGESQTAAVRSVFIIDPDKKLRLSMAYPMSVGRNFDEILRVIDALQTGDAKGVALPADWRPGDRAIIPPSVSNADAKAKFPQGFEEIRPYLRTVDITAA